MTERGEEATVRRFGEDGASDVVHLAMSSDVSDLYHPINKQKNETRPRRKGKREIGRQRSQIHPITNQMVRRDSFRLSTHRCDWIKL